MSTGHGPLCPLDPHHGRMLDHKDWGDKWYCPVRHGRLDGRFYTLAQVDAFVVEGEDEMMIYEDAAHAIMSGSRDFDEAVRSIAKSTKSSTDKVRERLNLMVKAAVIEDAELTEKKAEIAAAKAAKPKREPKPKAEKAPRVLKEHVEPAIFAEVRDRLGLKNSECAVAIGKSASRITELTRSEGASKDVYDAWVADLEVFATEKAERLAAEAAAAPAEPTAE